MYMSNYKHIVSLRPLVGEVCRLVGLVDGGLQLVAVVPQCVHNLNGLLSDVLLNVLRDDLLDPSLAELF